MTKESFVAGFFDALYFTDTGDTDQPPCDAELSPELVKRLTADCHKFWGMHSELIQGLPENAGHDFWLTRNGHGAGFWDGDWKEHGDTLTQSAQAFEPVETYMGDDGMIYA